LNAVLIAVSQDSARTWESSGVVSKTCAVRGLTNVRLDVLSKETY
jgi:hypothetical protein